MAAGRVSQVVVLSYTVMIIWEFVWADSALVVLGKWLSYKGGCLNRFDCNSISGEEYCGSFFRSHNYSQNI